MLISTMVFMWWKTNKAKLKELSNNISDRSEAKGTGIMSDLPPSKPTGKPTGK